MSRRRRGGRAKSGVGAAEIVDDVGVGIGVAVDEAGAKGVGVCVAVDEVVWV